MPIQLNAQPPLLLCLTPKCLIRVFSANFGQVVSLSQPVEADLGA